MTTESTKNLLFQFLRKSLPFIICSAILAFGIVKAASILSERPVMNTFNGTISSGNGSYSELMGINQLMSYLDLYPSMDYTTEEYSMDDYDKTVAQRRSDLQKAILNGDWPAFPYVQLNDQLYFSKEAVDEWFFEQGKQHLVVK